MGDIEEDLLREEHCLPFKVLGDGNYVPFKVVRQDIMYRCTFQGIERGP